ncbi:MAG: hypothetical protein WC552_01025 [Candidatus Omnitrophota bacterium]
MFKSKIFILGIGVGIVSALVLGLLLKKTSSRLGALTKKITAKLDARRFANVKKAKDDYVIADFENAKDLEKFDLSDAEVSLSDEYATSGKFSAEIRFKKSPNPSFRISESLRKERKTSWAPYSNFRFDIYNPGKKASRYIIQIKDEGGKRYKEDIVVDAGAKDYFEVAVAALRDQINVYNVEQVNIFQWKPQEDSVCFLDNMRLVSEGNRSQRSIFSPGSKTPEKPPYALKDYSYFPGERWKTDTHDYKFPVYVLNPKGIPLIGFPVTGGVPFPRGVLHAENEISVEKNDGQIVPFQSRVTARWNDGSIKWVLVTIPATVEGGLQTRYFIRYPSSAKASPEKNLIAESSGEVVVDTGAIKFSIDKKQFRLFDKVWIDGGMEVISSGSDLTLQFKGDTYYSSLDKDYILTVEENGPLAGTLKAEGWFISRRGKKFCKFLVRIKAYKDQNFVRVYHTFIYTGYPENQYHYLYKGKNLPKNEPIEDISVHLDISQFSPNSEVSFVADNSYFKSDKMEERIQFLQKKHDHFVVSDSGKKTLLEGERLDGLINVSDGQKGLCLIVRKMWQQFPKGFELDLKNQSIKIDLWPAEAGVLDLRTTDLAEGPEAVGRGSAFGLAKTHEMVYCFHPGNYSKEIIYKLALIHQEPPLIVASPEWLNNTRALGGLAPYDPKAQYFKKYEEVIERLFDWGDRQKKTFKWYGMINFGDVLSDHGSVGLEGTLDESGWYRDGRWGWYNQSVTGLNWGSFIQFLRTGEYKYFEFAEDSARHVMDIDTVHYNTVMNDPRLKGKIPDDYSQVGSMHRHNADHWGGRNEMAGYTNLNGILLYYYLTGYERALDVAKEVGEFFLKRPVIYFQHPDIAPGRAVANILWGELLLYEATQDSRLKEEADYWADLFYRGQNRNGSWNEDYNPKYDRWDGKPHDMYMTGYIMPALIEYHKNTLNEAMADSIVQLTDYLIKHIEYYPFFDGLAYSYYLTGDKKYTDEIMNRLNYFERYQRKQDDPLWNGMIFQKITYTRMGYFVYNMPYAFDALELLRAGQSLEKADSREKELKSQNEPNPSVKRME